MNAFLDRPIEGDRLPLWTCAAYLKVRRGGWIFSVALIIAVGVNTDGRREVLGLEIGTSGVESIWKECQCKFTRRGLRGVKLGCGLFRTGFACSVWDEHEGINVGVSKVLFAICQRCRVHFMRNVMADAGKSGRRVVSAFIAADFARGEADLDSIQGIESPLNAQAASTQWRAVADQIRPKVPKLATIMECTNANAEFDVLAYMTFPKEHRAKLHSPNPIERLNGEIKRRTDVVGSFPNNAVITRLVGAMLLEQNDEWAVQRARYMILKTMAPLSVRQGIDPPVQFPIFLTPLISLPVVARSSGRSAPAMAVIFVASHTAPRE